jgi:PQQ-dependent catabolism-associated CXXCW motif protein
MAAAWSAALAAPRNAGAPALAMLRLPVQPEEMENFGVPPTGLLRRGYYEAPTPLRAPGAATVNTAQLSAMLAHRPLIIDVRTGNAASLRTIVGAAWWPWAGLYGAPYGQHFEQALEQATGGDKSREIVFSCLSSRCWLSYNAALRAVRLGYRYVRWYRGGWDAWSEASGPSWVAERVM